MARIVRRAQILPLKLGPEPCFGCSGCFDSAVPASARQALKNVLAHDHALMASSISLTCDFTVCAERICATTWPVQRGPCRRSADGEDGVGRRRALRRIVCSSRPGSRDVEQIGPARGGAALEVLQFLLPAPPGIDTGLRPPPSARTDRGNGRQSSQVMASPPGLTIALGAGKAGQPGPSGLLGSP